MFLRSVSDKSGVERPLSVPGLVAGALLAHDVPDSTVAERGRAARYVEECVEAMPDFTRAGVRVTALLVYVVLSVAAGRPYRSLSEGRRTVVTMKLTRFSFPVLAEFVRLNRGLGLAFLYEQRTSGVGSDAA